MTHSRNSSRGTAGWTGIQRGHRARSGERIAEIGIFTISLSAIALIFLIFVFVGREAWPILVQGSSVNSAAVQDVIPAGDLP
ncbi:MAG: hypothetical protein EXS36_20160 [Pedosphaera sp.]|nr:hypothetical protein [Pedosphaera sp.]